MRLSDYFKNIHRDAEFDCLGKIPMKPDKKMLSFADKSNFLKNALNNPDVTAIITTQELAATIPDSYGVAISDMPRRDFWELHNKLADTEDYAGKKSPSIIPDSCKIHPSAVISPYNVVLGERVMIEPFVFINENVTIGDDCIIRAHTNIGAKQFEFYRVDDKIMPVQFCGHTRLGKHVELQEHNTIGRAIFPWVKTTVGDYTKTSNNVSVGESSHIGRACMISSMTALCGNVTVGDDVWVGAGCTISNRIAIEKDARVSIGAVVLNNVAEGQTVTGNPAIEHSLYLRDYLQKLRQQSKSTN